MNAGGVVLPNEQLQAYNQTRPAGVRDTPCLAPFNAIYIGHRGRIWSCCANKVYTLGVYPDQSLEQIWFGEKADGLRASLSANDFSKGCQVCYHRLRAGNYNVAARGYDLTSRRRDGYPTRMEFELSNTCNLECVMCRGEFSSSIRKNRDQKPPIPVPYDSRFLDQLESFIPPLESARFLGGEPFLIPLYEEVWEMMIRLNPRVEVTLQTNGTIMNPRVRRVLENLSFSISVSIDSVDKENFERIRKNSSFDTVVENLRIFQEYSRRRGTHLSIVSMVMPQNWWELPELVAFANRLGVSIFLGLVVGPKECSLSVLPSSELEGIIERLSSHEPSARNEQERQNRDNYRGIINQLGYWRRAASHQETVIDPAQSFQDLEDFFDSLRALVLSGDHDDPDSVFRDIREKLEFVLTRAEADGFQGVRRALINVDQRLIIDYSPHTDRDRLYELFKENIIHA
jgi:MoaA/NifB/PqqE/SkfB family radical SAM enzyme